MFFLLTLEPEKPLLIGNSDSLIKFEQNIMKLTNDFLCAKYQNYTELPVVEILLKCTVSAEFWVNQPKLCENCALLKNFHTTKFDEVTTFYAVFCVGNIYRTGHRWGTECSGISPLYYQKKLLQNMSSFNCRRLEIFFKKVSSSFGKTILTCS